MGILCDVLNNCKNYTTRKTASLAGEPVRPYRLGCDLFSCRYRQSRSPGYYCLIPISILIVVLGWLRGGIMALGWLRGAMMIFGWLRAGIVAFGWLRDGTGVLGGL